VSVDVDRHQKLIYSISQLSEPTQKINFEKKILNSDLSPPPSRMGRRACHIVGSRQRYAEHEVEWHSSPMEAAVAGRSGANLGVVTRQCGRRPARMKGGG
jgi:hypothetical protein